MVQKNVPFFLYAKSWEFVYAGLAMFVKKMTDFQWTNFCCANHRFVVPSINMDEKLVHVTKCPPGYAHGYDGTHRCLSVPVLYPKEYDFVFNSYGGLQNMPNPHAYQELIRAQKEFAKNKSL